MRKLSTYLILVGLLFLSGCINLPGDINVNVDTDDDERESSIRSGNDWEEYGRSWEMFGKEVARDFTSD